MNREDIIRMAQEAGLIEKLKTGGSTWYPDNLERFFHMAQAAERERNTKEFPVQFGSVKAWEDWCKSIRENERKTMIEQGWRQCAKGQRTTQFCGMVEQAVKAEREACAKDLDELSEAAKDLYAKGFVWKAIKESAAVIRARGNQ